MEKMQAINLSSLADKWPSSFVAREEVDRFSGGMITAKYMANLDCAGTGPEGRVRIGRKIAYPVESVIRWLEERATVVKDKRQQVD
jgi:hypothetical protein